jgi:hypothetical protein
MVGMLCLLSVSMSAAQNKAKVADRPPDGNVIQEAVKLPKSTVTPRTPDGHPDLSGFYLAIGDMPQIDRSADGSLLYEHHSFGQDEAGVEKESATPNPAPYKPEYLAKAMALVKDAYGGTVAADPMQDCVPMGVPRLGVSGVMHIVQDSKYVAILYEKGQGPVYRVIYIDGRPHPKDLDTSYMGDSIGHWDGDTLVVDVTGLNDETWLSNGTKPDYASIHSDKLHVIERYTRKGSTLTLQQTVEDPVMFTRPWVLAPRSISIGPSDDYIQPEMCIGRDKAHIIKETATDKHLCNWCNTDSLYGGSKDTITTGEEVPDKLKEQLKEKAESEAKATK